MSELASRLQAALGSAYRVERELGGGGMSRVYLAEEVALGRRVVVKVLPPEMGAGVNAERFRREIQLAASLQHPHIVPLLNAGQTDDLVWYTMPLIEGQSLREKLTREGELPVLEAVRILRDVADALAYAHQHGVVHRDIKPDNVLISGRHAVVTDFGVAKAITEAVGKSALTSAGIALGTPAYMAPEQATASPQVDHRADLYALGAMAYEMLTGEPPFAGDAQAVLTAQVIEAPREVSARRAAVPPALAALVMRCLEKKAADRWQSAAELHTLLEGIATPSGGTTPTAAAPRRRSRLLLTVFGSAAGLLVIGLIARQVLRREAISITASDISPVTSEPGVEYQPALSPDGKQVAFVAGPIDNARLVIRSTVQVTGGGEFRLADTSLGSQWLPSWSPDGEFVRFWACPPSMPESDSSCVWKETGRLGGGVRSVPLPRNTSTASWSPDGTRVAFSIHDSIFSYSAADRKTALVAVRTVAPRGPHSLAWSPDGRLLAYVNGNERWRWSGNISGSSIWVVAAAGGEPVRVTGAEFLNVSPAWLDDRHLLFVSNRDGPRGIYVVEVGPRGARGEAQVVLGASDGHSIAYSATGRRLVYAKFSIRQNIWSYPIGRSGPISMRGGRRETDDNQVIELHDPSPDGRWIAYDNNLGGNMNLYKRPLGGGAPVPLTHELGDEFSPRWSPDGTEIAYYGGIGTVFVIPADGGTPVALPGSANGSWPAWSPSGLQIAMTVRQTASLPAEGWLVSRDRVGGPWHEAVRLTDFGCHPEDWAPDGSGLLCSTATGLALVSPEGRVLWRRDLAITNHLQAQLATPKYSRDGSTIYFAAVHEHGRRGIWAIQGATGAPRLVISADDPARVMLGYLSVGPDRIYLTVSEYESDVWVMRLRW